MALIIVVGGVLIAVVGGVLAARANTLFLFLGCVAAYVVGVIATHRAIVGGPAIDGLNTAAQIAIAVAVVVCGLATCYAAQRAGQRATSSPSPGTTAGSNYVPKSGGPVRPTWGRRRYASRAPASRYAGYRRAAPRGG